MNEYYENLIEMMREIEGTIYSKDEHEYLGSFVNSYSEDKFDEIKFNWNGKQGDELQDSNFSFREKVMSYYIIHPPKEDNILLLRDLFVEQCKLSNETWGVTECLGIIGEKLLNASTASYIVDFIEYYVVSMDTYAVCSNITLTKDAKKEAISKINSLIDNKDFNRFDDSKLKNDLEWVKNRQVYL